MITTSEERRNRRISYQAPVGGMLVEDQKVLNMISTNLSHNGMFVDLADVPPIGSELICNLATAGGRSAVQIRGRITWHNGESGVGIEFIDLSDEQAREIDGLIGDGFTEGEQSAAVYELMKLEAADTSKTQLPVDEHMAIGNHLDVALDAAVDTHISEAMEDVSASDVAFLLPATPPVPKYDSLDEPAFTSGPEVIRAELPEDDTEAVAMPSREPRSWLLAAGVGTVGALAIGLAGFGLFSSESSSHTKGQASELALDGKRERVLALVEGDTTAPQAVVDAPPVAASGVSDGEHGNPSVGVGGPIVETAPTKKKAVATARQVPKEKPARAVLGASEVRRQVLGGVVVRETSDSFLLRFPFTGSAENARHYFMNEPAAVAVNLPNATPTKGFSQSLEPKGDAVRLVWVRERQGGTHFRVFFNGSRPTCELDTAKQELVLRCKR